jgi:O-antigen/teichoic acid export membrane protein
MSSSLFRIGKNVFSNWAGYIVNIVVSFFLAPFMVHSLGNAGYGIWVLVGSLTGYLGVMDLGLRPAVVKFVARYRSLDDDLMVNRVVNTILIILSVVAAAVFLASLVLSYFSLDLFNIPAEYHGQFRLVIIIVGLNIAASFPFSVFGALLPAIERFDLGNAVQICVFLVRALLLVIFLSFGGGLIAVGVIVLTASMAEFILKARLSFKHIPSLKLDRHLADRQTFKMIASFSGYAFVINVASRLSLQSDAIVIGAMLSPEAITSFAIGSTMIDYLLTLISYMSTTILPMASAFEAQKNYEKLRQLLVVGTKYCVAIILPISITYVVLGETFINIWMGPQYGPDSAKVLAILTVGYFGFLSQFVANVIFIGLGKLKYLAYLNVGLAVVNLGLSVILVRWLGIYGSALGTAIPLIVSGSIVYPIYICRTVQLDFWTYALKSYLRPMLASLPFLALVLLSHQWMEIDSFARFAIVIAVSCLVHAVALYFGVLEPGHRSSISQKVRSMLSTR